MYSIYVAGSCSLYILAGTDSHSSRSTSYPVGLGSLPWTQRQVNPASDLSRKLPLSTPHPTPGVSLLHVMGSYDKVCTHLIETVIWFPQAPTLSNRKPSLWQKEMFLLAFCLHLTGLCNSWASGMASESSLYPTVYNQELAENLSLAFKIPVRNSYYL